MVYGDGILESPADRYGKTTLCMRNAKRLFKCVAYVVYFVGVLVFAVASKGSLLLMTQSLGNRLQVSFDLSFCLYNELRKSRRYFQEKQYASRWSLMLVATICVPYVFLFLEALAKSLFRNRRGPVFTDMITVKGRERKPDKKTICLLILLQDFSSREYSYIWCLSTRFSCSTEL